MQRNHKENFNEKDEERKPNFLIIGAPRSGTTLLYENLRYHPEIFMPEWKEPMYFLREGTAQEPVGPTPIRMVRSWEDYLALFESASSQRAIGEASTFYLQSASAPARIRNRIPEAKLIAILRHPVQRAFSHYQLNRLSGSETHGTFREALEAEEQRRRDGWFPFWHYREAGFYGKQLKKYLEVFPLSQIRIIFYEELISDFSESFRKVCQFLEVNENISPRIKIRVNASGRHRRKWVQHLLEGRFWWKKTMHVCLPKHLIQNLYYSLANWNIQKMEVTEEDRNFLMKGYHNDILLLQDQIRRDLTPWLQ